MSKENGEIKPRVMNSRYEFLLKKLLNHEVDELSVEVLKKKYQEYLILDSRKIEEFEVSHMPEARWVGYDNFDLEKLKDLDTQRKILVYCSVGYRSEKIAEKLKSAGYKDVYNLYGGIFEWINQKGALVDNKGFPSQRVHAYNRIWGIWVDIEEKVYGTQ